MKNNLLLQCAAGTALLICATANVFAQASVDSVVTSGLFEPYAVAADADGSTYVTDGSNHRVIKIPNGLTSFTVLAGQTGVPGTNNGIANAAKFSFPQGIVLARGGLVVADSANHLIRFVSLSGVVTNLAGAAGAYGTNDGMGAAARFRYPMGLAADAEGNIYIADSQNNSIRKLDTNNNVTTVKSGFFQPAAVEVGANGDLWVTDTRRHCIKIIDTNGVVTLAAGVPTVSGTTDSIVATNAQFSSPRGLLWLGSAIGVLVSDSGNHTIRRIYYNTNFATYSVETYAGMPGVAGASNGPALAAQFNSPIGIARDPINGGFYVVDKSNNQLRRITTGTPQPPVTDPIIGWVDLVKDQFGDYTTLLRPVVNSTFNNDVVMAILAELGTATYYTVGPTPPSQFEDNIPTPGPGVGNNPPAYRDGAPPSQVPASLTQPQPDLTIKAIGTQDGRRSSAVVQSRFIFKTANPTIVGDNAALFTVSNVTAGAQMFYTLDGSEPTNTSIPFVSGDTISFDLGGTNRTFKVKAFRNNYRPSDTITKVFSPTNFIANKISFGFANGEASSEFIAAAGQRFYAPVTLSVLQGQSIYSFQFNVTATNDLGSPAIDGSLPGFRSALEYPVLFNGDQVGADGFLYKLIPPAMVIGVDTNFFRPVFQDLLFTNSAVNVLGVGWVERYGLDLPYALYPTPKQDLVKYSQPHDTVFDSINGRVVLGGYSFVVPPGAADGSTYTIQLGRASATSDGVSKDVYIQVPTNGSLTAGPVNGTKRVTVGSRRYVVGDCAPFRWFNAGDFGDTNLINSDVLQVFQSAVYGINLPPIGSDFFDSMDSSDGNNPAYFNGSDYSIDAVQQGDGQLNVDDIFVTFRRSLDPSVKWFARFWSNGVRQVVEVPNYVPLKSKPAGNNGAPSKSVGPSPRPAVAIAPDDVIGSAGQTVQVPVRVHITGGLPLRVLGLSVTVEPLDGSPELSQNIDITSATGLGSPTFRASQSSNHVAATWLNQNVSGVTGDAVLATVSVTLPASAGPDAAYRVRIDHFSCSDTGIRLFTKYINHGLITLRSRTSSTWDDGISDAWRLRYFGSVSHPLSAATADPDGDGVNNLSEFQAGSNPLEAGSMLKLSSTPLSSTAIKLFFPTGSGRTYVLEYAPEIVGPWAPLCTNAGNGGIYEYTNTVSGVSKRFYRLKAN
jgi:hypothetical protein